MLVFLNSILFNSHLIHIITYISYLALKSYLDTLSRTSLHFPNDTVNALACSVLNKIYEIYVEPSKM